MRPPGPGPNRKLSRFNSKFAGAHRPSTFGSLIRHWGAYASPRVVFGATPNTDFRRGTGFSENVSATLNANPCVGRPIAMRPFHWIILIKTGAGYLRNAACSASVRGSGKALLEFEDSMAVSRRAITATACAGETGLVPPLRMASRILK